MKPTTPQNLAALTTADTDRAKTPYPHLVEIDWELVDKLTAEEMNGTRDGNRWVNPNHFPGA